MLLVDRCAGTRMQSFIHVGVQGRYTGMAARVSVHMVSTFQCPECHRPLLPCMLFVRRAGTAVWIHIHWQGWRWDGRRRLLACATATPRTLIQLCTRAGVWVA